MDLLRLLVCVQKLTNNGVVEKGTDIHIQTNI